MSQHLFRFTVEAMSTKETTQFIGQGKTIEEALKDGKTNCQSSFRPKTDGRYNPEFGFMVTLPDGRTVRRTVPEFESSVPYCAAPASKDEALD